MSDSVNEPRAFIPGRNGGRLNTGGTPGNKGGTGRTSNEVMGLARGELTPDRLKHVGGLVKSGKTEAVQLAAVRTLAEIGVKRVSVVETVTVEAEEVIGRIFKAMADYFAGQPDEFDRLAAFVRDRIGAG